jgi:glucosamine--fructose-6-phosphate aminotransferase (isomerizing)
MCGIIGIVGRKNVAHSLVDGLKRLEYRGYDSAGIATLDDSGNIQRLRAEGKLINLENKLNKDHLSGHLGIGHTRWATHGRANENNAHPHATDRVAVVHNGIIENYKELKEELEAHQFRFETETDTEVVAHLVTYYLKQGMDPRGAAHATANRLHGAYSIVLLFKGEEDLLIAVRQGTPLAVGYGDGEMFVASDSYALAPLTRRISFLEDGDRVIVTHEGAEIFTNDNAIVQRLVRVSSQQSINVGKGEYRHYMLKELHEQPVVIGDTLNSLINPATGSISIPPEIIEALDKTPRINIVACGTTFYAASVAKYWFESIAKLPCDVGIASEFRYRDPVLPEGGTAMFISQSGETLDTLEALRLCKRNGQKTICLVNTIESTIERESDLVMHTQAGPEIGVASTKAFTTQITTMACIVLALARHRGTITQEQEAEMAESLRRLPAIMGDVLARIEPGIQSIAREIYETQTMIYLGRGLLYPVAMEGALKIKEVSYIHAEAYAAGELKHGPIALVDENLIAFVIAPGNDPLFEKNVSNIQEIVARGARVMLATDDIGAEKLKDVVKWTISTGISVPQFVTPILYALPVQLLAYYVATTKGTDVDQPRNLAKAVTVE